MNVLKKIKDVFSSSDHDEELASTRSTLKRTRMQRLEQSIERKRELVRLNRAAGNFEMVRELEIEINEQLTNIQREKAFYVGLGLNRGEENDQVPQ